MDDFTRASVEIAMKRMFRVDGWLDICLVDQLVKVVGVVPPAAEYSAMRLLHCVNWRDMPEPVRNEAARRLLSWFSLTAFDPWAVQVAPTVKVGTLGRLLGRGTA